MGQNLILNSIHAPEPVGAYPHARRIGDFLFISGVGPRLRGSSSIPGVELDELGNIKEYDIAIQTVSVFQNIKYVLEDSGSCFEDIVDITIFLTNMKKDFINLLKLQLEIICESENGKYFYFHGSWTS